MPCAVLARASHPPPRLPSLSPPLSLWCLSATSASSTKAYTHTGERSQKKEPIDGDEHVPALLGAARGQDWDAAQVPPSLRLFAGGIPPIGGGGVSSLQEKAVAVPPPLVSTLDGDNNSETTTVGADSGSGSSGDGNAAAPPASPSTVDGRCRAGAAGENGDGSGSSIGSSSEGSWSPGDGSATAARGKHKKRLRRAGVVVLANRSYTACATRSHVLSMRRQYRDRE